MLPESAQECAKSPWLWAIPGIGAFCGTGTIAAVYHLAASGGHLPPNSTTPPISFLGVLEPDAWILHLACMAHSGLVAKWLRAVPLPQKELTQKGGQRIGSKEHTVYQLGFLVTGLLLAASVRLWSAVFAPLLTAAGLEQCAQEAWLDTFFVWCICSAPALTYISWL